ncbi:MAG TPA: heavy metal-responsive transcriptional regulator [Pyrinomonadaceae bacterium]
MRAGELARAAGVSTDTLRHYERKGVLARPRRAPNGYRLYPPEALAGVRLVRRALAVGFTLDELASILRERSGGARPPCRRVRELAAQKLAAVEERLSEMASLRDELRAILRRWDERLARAGDGARAGLLEALSEDETRAGARVARSDFGRRARSRERKNDVEK